MQACKFVYTNGYVRAQEVKPRPPIPPLDTIRFELKRRASGGKIMRDVIIYMRPDEAVAAAAVLLHAVWGRMVSP